jgi:hypothetical protein
MVSDSWEKRVREPGGEIKGGGTVDYDLDAQFRRAEEFHSTDN